MPPTNRKRFNAFEDFSTPAASAELPHPLPPTTSQAASSPKAIVERIERLKPSQMLPDRFQPRRLLPGSIRTAFFSGKMDCYQAAAEWISTAQKEPLYQAEIDRLLAMGASFEEHGQIKPITGSWVAATNGEYIFQIETGERRFWAACLRVVRDQIKEEPSLRVDVVEKPTRQRQVLENRHAEPPSAVGQACEVASLILAELGITPAGNIRDEYDYFRQAYSQRMPSGLWERLMPVMQLTRPRMVQLLNILQLPTPLLELADRSRLPERVLREVLSLPPERWEIMIRLSIQNNLTSEDVVDISKQAPEAPVRPSRAPSFPQPAHKAVSGLRRFARTISELDEVSQSNALDQIADELVGTREAEGLMVLLDELAALVNARLSRK